MRTEALIAILLLAKNLPAMLLFGLFSKRHLPKFVTALGEEPFTMNEHVRTINKASDKIEEQKLLVFTLSDEALEKAAGGTPPAHPGTGVATICVREPSDL